MVLVGRWFEFQRSCFFLLVSFLNACLSMFVELVSSIFFAYCINLNLKIRLGQTSTNIELKHSDSVRVKRTGQQNAHSTKNVYTKMTSAEWGLNEHSLIWSKSKHTFTQFTTRLLRIVNVICLQLLKSVTNSIFLLHSNKHFVCL